VELRDFITIRIIGIIIINIFTDYVNIFDQALYVIVYINYYISGLLCGMFFPGVELFS